MRILNIILSLLCLAMTCVAIGAYRQSVRYRGELKIVKGDLAALREKTDGPVTRESIPALPPPIRGERLERGETSQLDAAMMDGMQTRMAVLDGKLEQRDQQVLDLQEQLRVQESGEKNLRERMETSKWAERARQRMELLRERRPEEYERAVEKREAAHEELAVGLEDRMNLFTSVDRQSLTPEYNKNHNALLIRMRELGERLETSNVDPASEDAWQTGRAMFKEFGDIGRMMNKERDILFNDFAVDLGFSDEDATLFVDYMVYVNDMTSPRAFFRNLQSQGW